MLVFFLCIPVNNERFSKSIINQIIGLILKFTVTLKQTIMNNIFRGLLAGYGAKKLGGGCFGTIIVFIILWVLLGQCN